MSTTPLPDRDQSKPAEQQGLFRKFDVRRTDCSDQPGGKHHGCDYFVLDVGHDPHAAVALTAYAAAVESTHPALAADMRARYALAAPAQQPVAMVGDLIIGVRERVYQAGHKLRDPLYAAPRRQPELLEWAVARWRDEVQHRPLVNKHRRSLDDTWRQVIRYAGGDPTGLIGPPHDELVSAKAPEIEAPSVDAAVTTLQQIAAIAHDGGLAGLSEADALVAIRRLTLPHWGNGKTREQRAASVHEALAVQKATK